MMRWIIKTYLFSHIQGRTDQSSIDNFIGAITTQNYQDIGSQKLFKLYFIMKMICMIFIYENLKEGGSNFNIGSDKHRYHPCVLRLWITSSIFIKSWLTTYQYPYSYYILKSIHIKLRVLGVINLTESTVVDLGVYDRRELHRVTRGKR